MKISMVHPPPPMRRQRVIALHCSGAGGSQWADLAKRLGAHYEVLTPEHYGCDSSGPWTGNHAFTLADEAARTIALIDASEEKVHLVGHSYGGGVALHVAVARRARIASMTVYEPSVFHLLTRMGGSGVAAHGEITELAREVSGHVVTGNYRSAAAAFVKYWNGADAWDAMRPTVQDALTRWAPKAPLDFGALINDQTLPSVYRALNFPVLILRGEHALTPSHLLAEGLLELLPAGQLMVINGAGHMGPFTHGSKVSALIMRHIVNAKAAAQLPHRRAAA
jgi:pimeloyl-ACP methyl ester carboxylesterase